MAYRIFAGPPNFEDVRRGDTPEPDYILELDKPVCAEGDNPSNSATKVDRVPDAVAGQGKRPEHLQDDLAHLRVRVVVKSRASTARPLPTITPR